MQRLQQPCICISTTVTIKKVIVLRLKMYNRPGTLNFTVLIIYTDKNFIMKTFKFSIDTNKYEVSVNSVEKDIVNLTLNGKNYAVAIEREKEEETTIVPLKTFSKDSAPAAPKSQAVPSPLPGTILKVVAKAPLPK